MDVATFVIKQLIVKLKPAVIRASIWSRLGGKHEVPLGTQRSNLEAVLSVALREVQPAKGERERDWNDKEKKNSKIPIWIV